MTQPSDSITVCHLTYSFFPLVGGMEEFIHNLCLSQVRSGSVTPVILAPRVRGRSNRLDVPYRVCRFSRPSSKRYGLEQVLLPALLRHASCRFDVIHAHGVYPSGYLAQLFSKMIGVPFVVTPEGGDLEGDDTGCIVSPNVHRRITRCFGTADRVTAISSDMRRRIVNLGAVEDRLVSIPHGVWTDEFLPSESYETRTSEDSYIAYIGSHIHRKGLDTLLEAYGLVLKEVSDVRLRIAGTGPLTDELKAETQKLGVSEMVDFVGVVRDEEKVKFLQSARFMVCPSRGEPFGIVNVEGLAAGVPVVATKVGGIPDIIEDGVNGFLVEPEDAARLAEKMRDLLTSRLLCAEMATAALKRAEGYDWGAITSQYTELYRDMLA